MKPLLIVGSYLSPYVRKVLVCLEIKNIAYEIDHFAPFFGLSPRYCKRFRVVP